MIAGKEGCEEDTGLRALTPTDGNEGGHLIAPAEFQKSHSWSAAWTITGWSAATDPEQGKPDTSKSDSGGPETAKREMSHWPISGSTGHQQEVGHSECILHCAL